MYTYLNVKDPYFFNLFPLEFTAFWDVVNILAGGESAASWVVNSASKLLTSYSSRVLMSELLENIPRNRKFKRKMRR